MLAIVSNHVSRTREKPIIQKECVMGLFTMFGPSESSTSSSDGKTTTTTHCTNGHMDRIQQTDNKTGKTWEREVCHGVFGPYAGSYKK
ncbi:MAG: hypothetical protein UX70_C0001G0370 [Candidatus Wolfebacteria bacterium GW2011_GWB1_47_1]|uniref:Uncharacterized protein n=1 Tax=Candidatus Wolfebacteria bacterium GW2011_GWB1_47_1 TaxID=1619007 RepID=A0A0G4ASE8_9BACT|nr:MAG: hypothetical protein UX70_C0001G0370 [Candidatus Wolfebacteria bacterium GW2011_GWB1_47_1]